MFSDGFSLLTCTATLSSSSEQSCLSAASRSHHAPGLWPIRIHACRGPMRRDDTGNADEDEVEFVFPVEFAPAAKASPARNAAQITWRPTGANARSTTTRTLPSISFAAAAGPSSRPVYVYLHLEDDPFAVGFGGEGVVDPARDRRHLRDDPDALPGEVLEEGHDRRHKGGLVAGTGAQEGRVHALVRAESAEPSAGREDDVVEQRRRGGEVDGHGRAAGA